MSGLMERVTQKALALGVPLSVHLDLTWRCHLSCIHCYLTERNGRELTTAQLVRLLEELAECGTLFLLVSGGEVFLRPDFFEIVEAARELAFSVRVKTSGTLLDDEAARRLARLHVAGVDVSLYSHRPEVHDAVTRLEGSFARTVEAVRRLVAHGVKVRVVQVLMRMTEGEYSRVRELAAELGAEYSLDPTVTPRLDGSRSVVRLNASHAAWRKVFEDPELDARPEHCPLSPEPQEAAQTAPEWDSLPCSAGHTSCYISPSGDVYPCVQFPLALGNVTERPFREIWADSPAARRVRSIRVADLPICRSCEFLNQCSRCPGLAYMEGDLTGPSRLNCEQVFARTGRRPAPLAE